MARLEKPGWSARKEFKETLMKERIIKRSPQIKSLTRATKKDIDQVKKNLKQELPVLTAIGIRRYTFELNELARKKYVINQCRYRLPYHECVLMELKERGMVEVADYMEKLFEINANFKDEESVQFHDSLVERLKNSLINAEIAKRENNHLKETTILFDTVVFFQSLSSQWLWIVQEMFKKVLTSSAMIRDDVALINIFKFIYGQFLFHTMQDHQGALQYLNEARDASKGKNWNASKFLKTKQDNLYRECNILLYEIYHITAEKFRSIDPKMAVKTSLDALKCAIDSDKNEYIAKALNELGQSQMVAGDVTGALKIFAKYLAKVKRIPDQKSICDAHKQLAIAHQNLKDDDGTRKHLRLFKECANEYQLSDKFAEAHYLTGKYLLDCGLASDASSNIKVAFDTYKSLEMVKKMDESRYLLGISQGEEVVEEFMKLILHCGNKDTDATLKLLQWKNRRVPFWSSTSCVEIVNENVERSSSSEFASILFPNSTALLEKSNEKRTSTKALQINY